MGVGSGILICGICGVGMMPAINQVRDSLLTSPWATGWQSSVRCTPRGIQVCHHLSEAEIQTIPPKPHSRSIGVSKKKKKKKKKFPGLNPPLKKKKKKKKS